MSGLRFFLAIGVVAVTILTALAYMLSLAPMQAELAARVDQSMVEAGQSWATGTVDGRTAVISGTAPTIEAQRLAVEAAAGVGGIRRIVDASGILPLQMNYVFAATRGPSDARLTGFVPSADVRTALHADLARLLPGVPIIDTTQLARGQPVDFLGLARFAIARMAELAEGSAALAGPRLSIEGTALDDAHFSAAAGALTRGLPANAELRTVRIAPPRAERFGWRFKLADGRAALSGYVPSELVRDEIASALRAALPSIAISDQTRLASGAPGDFGSAATFAAHLLTRLASGSAVIEDGTLTISGKAKSVEDHQAMLGEIAARRDRQGDSITIGTVDILPPFVDPYVWHAQRMADRIVLGGYVPTETVRNQVLDEATRLFPGIRIDNRLAIAAGDPKMDWIGALRFSLGQLALLSFGDLSLTGRQYAIAGEAASLAAFRTLTDELARTLPAGMALARNDILPAPVSPFVFSLIRTEKGLTLGGYVARAGDLSAIVAAAKARFPEGEVEVGVERAGGAPDGLVTVATASLQALSRLSAGRLELTDHALALSGAAVSDQARQAIERDLTAALPAGFQMTSTIIVAVGGDPLSADECQATLNSALETDEIAFDDSGAVLDPMSLGLVDRLAAIVQRCPAADVEIGGHTDSAGGAKRNKAISADRAEAVLEGLVADGVRRERLTAVGYGETKPVASNGSADGRARNRRITFTVQSR